MGSFHQDGQVFYNSWSYQISWIAQKPVKMNRIANSKIMNNPKLTHMAFRETHSKCTCIKTESSFSLKFILKNFIYFVVDICMIALETFQTQNSDTHSSKSIQSSRCL